jgi:hypothetical protein
MLVLLTVLAIYTRSGELFFYILLILLVVGFSYARHD